VLAPQLLGGATGWAIALITALACAALAILSFAGWRERRPAPALLGWLALGVALTGLQALPLPSALTSWLAPASAEAARLTADAAGMAAPSWIALSRDPGSTCTQLLQGLAILAAFLCGLLLARRGRRRSVLYAAAASVCVMALVALGHVLADADRVFGVYAPIFSRPPILAPLLNPNHLAGFLALGTPLLLGLGMDPRERKRRSLWLALAFVVGPLTFATLSRGGVAALLLGTTSVWLLSRRSASGARRAHFALLPLLLGAGAYLGLEPLLQKIGRASSDKLEIAWEGLQMSLEAPLLGVGRGAFSAVFAEHRGSLERFVYPENVIVQWISEWGFPFALVLIGALSLAALRIWRRSPSSAQLGALIGLCVLFLQNFVDFSLEMAGVAVVAAALLGALVVPKQARRRPRASASDALPPPSPPEAPALPSTPLWRAAPAQGLLVSALGALALLFLLPLALEGSVDDLQQQLSRALQEADEETFETGLERATRLHPSEPAFALLAAEWALRRDDPGALRWLNRGALLAPGWAGPRLGVARWLLRRGRRDQALLEIREAEIRQPGSARALVCALLVQDPNPEIALRAAPLEGEGRAVFLDWTARCAGIDPELSAALDRALLEERPEHVAALMRVALASIRADAPETALELSQRAARHDAEDPAPWLVRAEALIALERHAEALEALARAESKGAPPAQVLRRRARLHVRRGDAVAMRATIDRMRGLAAGSSGELARLLIFRGDLEISMDEPLAAMAAFDEADRFDPDSPALERLARLAEHEGNRVRAYQAWSAICLRRGATSCPERDRLSRALERSASPAQPNEPAPPLPPPPMP